MSSYTVWDQLGSAVASKVGIAKSSTDSLAVEWRRLFMVGWFGSRSNVIADAFRRDPLTRGGNPDQSIEQSAKNCDRLKHILN